jgi:hypothetical protein
MATTNTVPDYYQLQVNNTFETAYSKNGNFEMGQNDRGGNTYVKEILLQTSAAIASLPGSATITNVDIYFDIVSWSYSIGCPTVSVIAFEQNKASWTDNGSTVPTFNDFGAWNGTAWDTNCGSVSITAGELGTNKLIALNSTGVAFFQAMYDGSKSSGSGIVLSYDPGNFNYWWNGSNPEIVITYTTGGGPTARRRIIIM